MTATPLRALAATALLLLPATSPAAERPNVVFLLADDWRWDTLGCAGNPVVKTPHLDALAADGVRFTQCRVTTSICCVSRASLLTGQHMARHGIERFGVAIPAAAWAATYLAVFRAAGYHTGFVGKFGVGKARPADFDFLRTYEGIHWLPAPAEPGGKIHVTEKNARDALDFLAARPADAPFCLSVSFFAPHAEDGNPEQYLPQPWSEKLYHGVTIPVPPTADVAHFRALPPFLATDRNEGRVRWKKRFDTPDKYQKYMTNYYRLATEVDAAVGRLVAAMKKQGEYDRTVVVFSGDNGYFHGERGLADKWYPYEEALRVPLIVRDPRVPAARRGTTADALTLNIDIPPTLLTAAGLPVPPGMQGADVMPLVLAAQPPAWRDEFYYQHPVIIGKDRIPRSEAVVRRDLKYTTWPDFDYEEMYDLTADVREERNLAAAPARAAALAAMQKKLTTWRERLK